MYVRQFLLRQWRARSILKAAPVVLLWLAPAARGEQAPGVEILQVTAATPDTQVTLLWGQGEDLPPVAKLVVRDAFGEEMSSAWIASLPGESTIEWAPGALLGVAPHGPQYRVAVEDEAGALLGAPLDYRVGLLCDGEDHCSFHLRGGLFAPDALLLSGALEDALEKVAAAGEQNLLRGVVEAYPDLRGEAYTLAWELVGLGERFPSPERCSCHWTTKLEHHDSSCGNGCGAGHDFRVTVSEETPVGAPPTCGSRARGTRGLGRGSGSFPRGPLIAFYEIWGTTALTVDIGCWQPGQLGGRKLVIEGQAWQGVESFPTLELSPCDQGCLGGGVDFEMRYTADLFVATDAGSGSVLEVADFATTGLLTVQRTWQESTPVSGGTASPGPQSAVRTTSAPAGSTAQVSSRGTVNLRDSTAGRGVGSIKTRADLSAEARSLCTGPPEIEITSQASSHLPIDGAEINVMIGQCSHD